MDGEVLCFKWFILSLSLLYIILNCCALHLKYDGRIYMKVCNSLSFDCFRGRGLYKHC